MRHDSPTTEYEQGPHHVERYRRPWPIEWLKDHPKFAGFMEAPIDGGFTAVTMGFTPPSYIDAIRKMLDDDSIVSFAPYTAHMINVIHDDGPGRNVILRLGIKKR